ncbi:hypothetical protein LCGC14_0667620 [marine sediment metagenome]|uniref:Uncharacterized protein n=2 Tax=root TaxID=1 RepID=A0A831QZN5_9GAMM|nr:hypothetical protein [Marinobacter antarcticus]HEA51408.1 hypothetical protein [Marinobacter antarcticus]
MHAIRMKLRARTLTDFEAAFSVFWWQIPMTPAVAIRYDIRPANFAFDDYPLQPFGPRILWMKYTSPCRKYDSRL